MPIAKSCSCPWSCGPPEVLPPVAGVSGVVLLWTCHRMPQASSPATQPWQHQGHWAQALPSSGHCCSASSADGDGAGLAERLLEEPTAGPLDGHSPGWAVPCPPFPINRHSSAFPGQTRVAHGCCCGSCGWGQTPARLMLWELMACKGWPWHSSAGVQGRWGHLSARHSARHGPNKGVNV